MYDSCKLFYFPLFISASYKCIPLCPAVLSALSNCCCLFDVFQTIKNDDDDDDDLFSLIIISARSKPFYARMTGLYLGPVTAA